MKSTAVWPVSLAFCVEVGWRS